MNISFNKNYPNIIEFDVVLEKLAADDISVRFLVANVEQKTFMLFECEQGEKENQWFADLPVLPVERNIVGFRIEVVADGFFFIAGEGVLEHDEEFKASVKDVHVRAETCEEENEITVKDEVGEPVLAPLTPAEIEQKKDVISNKVKEILSRFKNEVDHLPRSRDNATGDESSSEDDDPIEFNVVSEPTNMITAEDLERKRQEISDKVKDILAQARETMSKAEKEETEDELQQVVAAQIEESIKHEKNKKIKELLKTLQVERPVYVSKPIEKQTIIFERKEEVVIPESETEKKIKKVLKALGF